MTKVYFPKKTMVANQYIEMQWW